jgi:hypothetical protein
MTTFESDPEIEFDLPSENEAGQRGPAEDEKLETELVLLLSRLERRIEQLRGERARQSAEASMQSLVQMVHEVVAFAEGLLGARRGAGLLGDAWRKARGSHPQVQLVGLDGSRLTVDLLLQRRRDWTGDPEERHAFFLFIGRGLVQILGHAFAALGRRFGSSEAAARWKGVSGVFILDLLQALDQVRF